jgi:hypothetical protein
MDSPAAPADQLTQQPGAKQSGTEQPGRRPPATRHYRGVLRFPVVRQLIRFTGVGVVCTATSLALYAVLRPWLGPQLANAVARSSRH